MKSLGYITLTEAEELSGIKADTLKKRCQEGKIVGAVKQGKTWFVPRNEIIKPIDAPSVDIMLSTLVRIAEAMVGTSITLLIKGTVMSGDLIPAKVYFQTLKENLKNSPQETQVPDEIYKSFDLVFETFEKSLPKNAEEAFDKQIGVLHLKNVRFKNGDGGYDEPSGVIRVKLNSVDGFMWGRVN